MMLQRSCFLLAVMGLAAALLVGCGGNGNNGASSGDGNSLSKAGDSGEAGTNAAGKSNNSATTVATSESGSGSSSTTVKPKQDVDFSVTRGGKKPASDDTLLLYYADDPDTLNFLTSSDSVSTAFQRFVYEPLAERNYAKPEVWEPVLAESWEYDADQLAYTIHLRKDVLWQPVTLPNGKQIPAKRFTSRDLTFTFDCILNENIEAASLRSYYVDAEATDPLQKHKIKVSRIDDYTVKVKWTKPYFMADEFTLGAGVIPRHVYSVDRNGEPISFDFSSKEFADGFNNHWANTTMCGTGPLIFKEWKKGVRTVLVRNPDYWGKPFYFSQVIYQYISNPNTALQKVLHGDLDWGGIAEKDLYVQSKNHDNVKSGKVVMKEYQTTSYRYLGYNLRREVFKDKNVRMALSYAVPVDRIINDILHGLAVRVTGPFVPGGTFSNNSLPPIPFDLAKARQMLDEAGWKDTNSNGIRDKVIDGTLIEFRFDLMIYSEAPAYQSIAEIIKAEFRKIGVEVNITPAAWALMLQKMRKKDFDAVILGWVADWKSDPFQIWHGSQADLPDSSNSGSYRNPEVDRLIEKLRVTVDEQAQIPIYHEIHRLIYEDQPYTFLFAEKATAGLNARIQNVQFYPMLRPHVDLREWYSSTPRKLGN